MARMIRLVGVEWVGVRLVGDKVSRDKVGRFKIARNKVSCKVCKVGRHNGVNDGGFSVRDDLCFSGY